METAIQAERYPIVELRQYTLHPGQRDTLIDLFERHFIESQNEVGMDVLAHYRDIDDPDVFVWFRGFRDMVSRGECLSAFYIDGAAWRMHREAANATMLDSDNVLLLREARAGSGFAPASQPRAAIGTSPAAPPLVVVTTYSFAEAADADFIDFFESTLVPGITAAGAKLLAAYATEQSANNFPRLPVREGENVFVWVAQFDSQAGYERYRRAIDASPHWRDAVQPELSRRLIAPPAVRRLAPAARSLVRD